MPFKSIRIIAAAALLAAAVSCGPRQKTYTVRFDGSKEMSGAKFAIADINPELPLDWDEYNFVVLEYRISTSQRFQLGFTTDWGYNEIRVMSYVPNAWNRLAIPLKYFTELPDPAFDVAATFNHPRYTGWVNLGGRRGPMHGVDSIGFRIRKAIGSPVLELRNVTLAVEDPGDLYMEEHPAIDRFGQQANLSYPEKVSSLAELEKEWRAEEAEEVSVSAFNYSGYGGYLQKQVGATGYFRIEQVDGRWWFVDPEGYLFLSVGVDCVNVGGGGMVRDADKRPGMYEELPPENLSAGRRGRPGMPQFGMWNLWRRYGEDFMAKAYDMTIKRMDKWGINTIANWSNQNIIAMNRKAFMLSLRDLGQDAALMGLCDIYRSDYKASMEASVRETTSRNVDNPWLIGYFVGNEPAWINDETRLCRIILEGGDRPIKAELQKYLGRHGDTDASRRAFIIETFRIFLEDVNAALGKYDPNHLNLGIRFAEPDTLGEDLLAACSSSFDAFSFNSYSLAPGKEMLDRAYRITGLPMVIGEYHFGTVERGLAQSLWQVDSEKERGDAYRYYTEQAYSHPAMIGTGYFQWSDQDVTGRFDGENYHCGLVDVTDRPYREQVNAMAETARVLYDVHCGTVAPFSNPPASARGHEAVPDLWNE